MNYKAYFKGKKITVLGLGLLGRGINITKFLAECGAELLVTDLKTKEQLATALRSLKNLTIYRKVKFVLGRHRLSDFRNCDMVIKAAGVPLDSPYIAEAKKNKIPVEMDASLFAKLVRGVTIIRVTGTRGKSKENRLIYEILKTNLGLNRFHKETIGQKTLHSKVFLAGNVRGMATLPLIKKVKAGDVVVMELDSWQLQGFSDSRISPHISVFTNFMRDHQNYYKGNMKKYFSDKANIYKYQKKGDYLVMGTSIAKYIEYQPKAGRPLAEKIIARGNDIPKTWKIKLLGEHNKENIACAIRVAEVLGIRAGVIRKAVEDFSGVPGRLEFVRTWNGISFYNDTTATTPDATMAALNALHSTTIIYDSGGVILIAGGSDKNLDYKNFVKEVTKKTKALILFSGTATEKIKKLLPKDFLYTEVRNMKEALKQALARSGKGDTVLLSPGAASFGIFKNEYDRGDQFGRAGESLK